MLLYWVFLVLSFVECDGRTYGLGCKYDCGACLGYAQCHYLNGSCLQGCDSGFQGELCKTGNV